MCMENLDCQEQATLDSVTLDYPDYDVTMEDLVCAYYQMGEGDEEDGEFLYDFCVHSSACETEGSLGGDEWWYVGCDDSASKLVAAGATALLLAFTM